MNKEKLLELRQHVNPQTVFPQINPDHIKIEQLPSLPTLFDSFQKLDQSEKKSF